MTHTRPRKEWLLVMAGKGSASLDRGGVEGLMGRPSTMVACVACGVRFAAGNAELRRGKGKTCSLSCAASLAAAKRDQSGEKNPNWKGGEPTNYRLVKRRYRARHPERAKAHMMVRDAVNRGDLSRQPCAVCNDDESEAHHDDYKRPLDVIWLCRRHHRERHAQ